MVRARCRGLWLMVVALCLTPLAAMGATRTATQSGNWNDPLTWGNNIPAPGDDFDIPSPFIVTLTQGETANSLNVQPGGTVNVQSFTLVVSTNIDVSGTVNGSTGTLQLEPGGFTLAGSGTIIPRVLFQTGGNRTIVGGANLTLGGPVEVQGTVSNSGTVTSTDSSNGFMGNGTWTHGSTGRLNVSGPIATTTFSVGAIGNIVDYRGTGQTIRGVTYHHLYASAGGTKTLGAAATVNGDLNIGAGILSDGGFQITGGGGTLTMSASTALMIGDANLTNNTSLPSFSSYALNATSTIYFVARANQTIPNIPYAGLAISAAAPGGSYTKSASGPITTVGQLLVDQSGGVTLTFDASFNNVVVGGDLAGAGTIDFGGGALQVNGSNTSFTGTVTPSYNITFGGTGVSNIRGTTYHNLIVSKTATVAALAAGITITNDLTVNSGILSDNNFQITGNGSGILTIASGAKLLIGTSFPTSYTNFSIDPASTVEYHASGAQIVATAPSYGNLILAASTFTHTKSLDGIAVSAKSLTFDVGLGVTLTFDINGKVVSIDGNIGRIGSGTAMMQQGASGGNLLVGGDFSNNVGYNFGNGGEVRYNGTGNQSVRSGTYAHMKVNKTSGVANLSGTTTVNDLLEVQDGELNLGSNILNTYDIGVSGATAILNTASGTLNAANGVSIGGSFTGTSSTVVVSGTNPTPNWSGGGTISLFNLTISNPNGMALLQNASASGTLALNGGILTVNPGSTLTVGLASRTSGYVDGELQINIPAATPRLFPLGTGGVYTPVDVTTVSGSGNVRIDISSGAHPSATGANVLQRYWSILTAVPTQVNLVFNYTDALVSGSENSYVIGRFDGSIWTTPGGFLNRTSNTATINGVSTYSGDWLVGYASSFNQTAPSVASFNPVSGSSGASISIYGDNLGSATTVTFFNGQNAGFTPVSDEELTATVPAGTTTGPISVTSGAGSGTSAANFTFIAPTTYTSVQNGNWNDVNTWGGSGFPGSADTANVGHFVTLTAPATVATLNLNGASIAGSPTLTVNNAFNWTAGNLSDTSGTISLAATCTTTISGAGSRTLERILTNAGTIDFTSSGTLIQHSAVTNNATINLQSDGSWTRFGSPTFTNSASGTVNRNTATGTFTFNVAFSNSGALNVTTGTLNFTDGFGNANTVNVSAGKTLQLSGSGSSSGTFTFGAGAFVDYAAGSHTFSGTATTGGTLRVSGATLTVTGTPSIANLTVTAGSITGSGALSVSGLFNWSGGSLFDSTGSISLGGLSSTSISGPAGRTLERALTNAGTITYTMTGTLTQQTATLTNNGTIDIQTSTGTWTRFGAPSIVNSSGANFNRSAGPGTFTINVAFTNGGAMALGAGTLSFTDSFSNGNAVTITSGTLHLSGSGTSGGSFTMNPGAVVDYAGGAHTFSGSATGGLLRVNGATLTISGTPSVSTLGLDSGAITGGGTLTVNTAFNWTGGTLGDSSGTLVLAGGTTNVISGAAGRTLSRNVTNGGTITYTTTGTFTQQDATFTNNGTVDIQSSGSWTRFNTPSIVNGASGNFNRTTTNSTFSINVAFTNNGTVTVNIGTLEFPDAFNNNSAVSVTSGTLLLSGSGTSTSGFTLSAGTTVNYASGSHTLSGNVIGGTLRVSGADLTVTGTPTFSTLQLVSGNVLGAGAISITTGLDWQGGSLGDSSGSITLNGGSTNTISGIAGRTLSRNLTSNSTITYTATGTLTQQDATFTNAGTLDIQSDATWTRFNSPIFNNGTGVVTKTAGTGTFTFNVNFNNSGGTVDVRLGKIYFTDSVTLNGSSTLTVGIGGTTPFTQHGAIGFANAVTFAGTLGATINGPYVPQGGDQYTILAFPSSGGTFGATSLGFGAGRSFSHAINPTTVVLTASGPTITSVTPSSGTTAGGTSVTVNGTGFTAGGSLAVDFGGSTCMGATVASAIAITCTTTAHVAGAVTVSMTNGDGQPTLKTNAFTFAAAPDITGLSVTTGTTGGGTYTEISGSNLATVTSVTFDGLPAEILSTTPILKVRTPPHAAGAVTVVATNPDGSDSLPLGFTYVNPTCTAPPGIVSWYKIDGNSVDSAGPNPINFNGGAFNTGKVSIGIDFNGTSEYGSVPNHPTLCPSSLTLEGWVKFASVPVGQYAMLFGKTAGTGTFESYGVSYKDGLLYFGVGSASGITYQTTAFTPTPARWYHVALTFDDPTNDLRLYVDGQLAASAIETATVGCDTHPLTLGTEYENESLAFFLHGSVDEVTLFNRQLGPAEVLAIYDADSMGKCFPAVPVVYSVTPNSGSTAGGTGVTISGSSLGSATNILFGGNTAAAGTNTQSSITTVTPAGPAGPVNVSVTTAAGTGTLTNGFTYVAPGGYTTVANGNWTNPATWGGTAPQSFDSATVLHSVTVDAASSITNLTVSGSGAINTTNNLTVNGTLSVNTTGQLNGSAGLTINGAGANTLSGAVITGLVTVAATRTLTISGGTTQLDLGSQLVNNGTINYTGGSLVVGAGSGAVITNNGTFDIQGDWDIANSGCCIGNSQFNNTATGTLVKSSGAGITDFQSFTALNNAGGVNVNSGTLRLARGGSSSSGTITIAALATLDYAGGTHAYSSTASYSGTGLLKVSAGTWNFSGTTFNAGFFELAGGTATFQTTVNTGALTFSGGTLGGTGGLTINGTGPNTWTGGTLAGLLSIGVTRALSVNGNVTFAAGANLVNNGNVQVNGGGFAVTGGANALIDNFGIFELTNDYSFANSGAGPGSNFNNMGSGTLSKTGGTGLADMQSNLAFNNAGTVNIVSGGLRLFGGGTSPSGTISIGGGSLIEYAGGTHSLNGTATVTSSGIVRVSAGSVNFGGGGLASSALEVYGGTASINAASSTSALTFGGGAIAGTSILSLNGAGPNTWSGGTLTAPLTVQSTRTLTIGGGTFGASAGTFTNNGTVNMTGSVSIANSAGLTITNTGTFDIQGNFSLPNSGCCSGVGTFVNNAGATLRKSAGTGTSTFGSLLNLTNSGLLDIGTGELVVDGNFTQGVNPAALNVYLAGVTPLTLYSRLGVGGNANLSGTLNVTLNGGFTPAPGNTFTVVQGGTVGGDFQTKSGLTYAGGSFTYGLNPTNVTLTATANNADITVSKSGPVSATTGQQITYTLFVQNLDATNTANTISLSDALSGIGLTYVSHTAPGGWNCNGGATFTCTAASLAPSASATILLVVTTPATPGGVTNVVNVSSANDGNGANNSSSFITNVSAAQVDLAVAIAGPTTVALPGAVNLTPTVTNNGTLTATNVTLTYTVPPQLTYVSATPTQGTCNIVAGVITCNLGTLASGGGSASATIVLSGTTIGGTISHTMTVSAAEGDANGADNTAVHPIVYTGGSSLLVTNTNAFGSGSLNQAVTDLNTTTPVICTTPCAINFALPGAAPYTIPTPATLDLQRQAILDGTSQPGYSGAPLIFLDGGANANIGINIAAAGSTVKGLALGNSVTAGIVVNAGSAAIQGNYIGLGADGITPASPGVTGILIQSAGSASLVGGTTAGEGNRVSHATASGIVVAAGSVNNRILGNRTTNNGALGIDHGGDDAPNNAPPTPVVSSATLVGGNVHVSFTSDASSFLSTGSVRVEFFRADGSGEGELLLASNCFTGNNLNTTYSFPQGVVVNGTPLVLTATPLVSCAGSATGNTSEFSAAVTVGGCTPPNTTITGPTAVCANSTTTYSVPFAAGLTYAWSATGAAAIGPTNGNTFVVTAGASGPITISVTVTDGIGCTATNGGVITVTAPPSTAITAPPSVCDATSGHAASVPNTAGATYSWSITGGTITAGQGTNAIVFSVPAGSAGVALSVTANANGCGSTNTGNVAVTSTPSAVITAPASVCPNSTANTASVPAVGGATYTWSVTGGILTTGQNTNSITFTAGASGTVVINVNVASGSCAANGSHNAAITAAPNVTISAPPGVCPNSTNNVASVPATAGATYNWTITGGTITAGQNTNSITFSAGASGNVVLGVTVTSGSCAATGSHTAPINAAPTITVTAPPSVCALSTNNVANATVVAGATYAWTITGGTITGGQGTSTIAFNAGASGNVVLNVTATVNGCASSGTATSPITPSPTATIVSPSQVQANSGGNNASVALQPGATYLWQVTNGSITSGQSTNGITFTAGNSGNVTLKATVTLNGCTTIGQKNVTIEGSDPADLSITKSGPASVATSGAVVYTLTVTNNGPAVANSVVVNDTLPGGMTLGAVTAVGMSCSSSLLTVTCSASSLAAGVTATITINATAPSSATTLTNTATVASQSVDPTSGNNSDSATTAVNAQTPTCPATPPSLNAPANGATNVSSPVTFSWSSVTNAVSYELWLGVDGAVPTLAGSTTSTSLTLPVASGAIEWFVVVRLGENCNPLESAHRTLTVAAGSNCDSHTAAAPMAPIGNTVASPVTFSWVAAPQAIGYRVWISVNGDAAQDLGTTDGATFLTAAVPPGRITWFVDALFSGCPATRSQSAAFTVVTDTCDSHGKASLTAPENGSTQQGQVDFTWTAVPNADGYRVWISINGAPFVALGTALEPSMRELVPPGTIHWFVESLFDGCPSTESDRRTFTVAAAQNCGNDRPTLIAPNDVTVTSANVTFSWNGVANAVAYELWLALDNGTPTLVATTPSTSLTREVAPGRLEWFVRALFNGCPARESQHSRFLYEPPVECTGARPLLTAPANNALAITSPVTFRWSAVPGATRYELHVGQGNSTPSLVRTVTTNLAGDVELQNGAKTWFVRAFFGGNCPPLDSTSSRFVVVPQPAACNPLAQPVIAAPGTISTNVSYTIDWNPIAGATGYVLQRSSRADFVGADSTQMAASRATFTDVNEGTSPISRYYRVRAIDSRCTPPSQSAYSSTFVVVILPKTSADASTMATNTQTVSYTIPLGPELAGQSFEATTTRPWLTVTPSSGVVPAGGTTLTVTANTAGLPLGANLGAVNLSLTTPTLARVAGHGTTVKTTTISVSLVTPVSETPKSTPPPDALIIPAVAHADGINSKFQSDVRVTNTSPQVMKYQLTFTPSGDEGLANGKQTTIEVEPGRTVALDDILESWFGGAESQATTGTLEVRPLTETSNSTSSSAQQGIPNFVTFAASRTFNATANGTFGQYIPAIPYANFIGRSGDALQASALSLQQIAHSAQYRTNLGFVEGSGQDASLAVSVFGSNGIKLTEFPVELRGGQHLQMNSFLADRGITMTDGRVEVRVTSETGRVTAYASVLDNNTADPLLVSPVALGQSGSSKFVLPGVADINNGIANWRTDMRLFNAGADPVNATLTFYSMNPGEAPRTTELTLEPHAVRELDATLANVFGVTNNGGAVHIDTTQPANLVATARTYNQTTTGTFGQFISAVTPNEAASLGSRPLQLLQIEESDRYRSNIGIAEVTGKPAKVEITVVPPDSRLEATIETDIAPNEFRQLNSLLEQMGLDNTYNARVTVKVIEGEGRVTAYASVIDTLTQDPTFVPAQ